MKCLIIGEKVRFRPKVPWKVVLRPKLPKIQGEKASPRKNFFGPPNLKILSTSLLLKDPVLNELNRIKIILLLSFSSRSIQAGAYPKNDFLAKLE